MNGTPTRRSKRARSSAASEHVPPGSDKPGRSPRSGSVRGRGAKRRKLGSRNERDGQTDDDDDEEPCIGCDITRACYGNSRWFESEYWTNYFPRTGVFEIFRPDPRNENDFECLVSILLQKHVGSIRVSPRNRMLYLETHGAPKPAKTIAFHIFPDFKNGSRGSYGTMIFQFTSKRFVTDIAAAIQSVLHVNVTNIDSSPQFLTILADKYFLSIRSELNARRGANLKLVTEYQEHAARLLRQAQSGDANGVSDEGDDSDEPYDIYPPDEWWRSFAPSLNQQGQPHIETADGRQAVVRFSSISTADVPRSSLEPLPKTPTSPVQDRQPLQPLPRRDPPAVEAPTQVRAPETKIMPGLHAELQQMDVLLQDLAQSFSSPETSVVALPNSDGPAPQTIDANQDSGANPQPLDHVPQPPVAGSDDESSATMLVDAPETTAPTMPNAVSAAEQPQDVPASTLPGPPAQPNTAPTDGASEVTQPTQPPNDPLDNRLSELQDKVAYIRNFNAETKDMLATMLESTIAAATPSQPDAEQQPEEPLVADGQHAVSPSKTSAEGEAEPMVTEEPLPSSRDEGREAEVQAAVLAAQLAERERLEPELLALREKVKALEDERQAAEQERAVQQSQAADADSRVASLEAEIARLREELAGKEREIADVRQQAPGPEDAEKAAMRAQIVELERLEPQLGDLRNQLKTLEDAKKAAEQEAQTLKVRLENLRESDLAVRLELRQAWKEKAAKAAEVKSLTDQLAKVQATGIGAEYLHEQVESLQQEKNALEQALRKHVTKYEDAEVEIEALRDIVTRLQHKIEKELHSELNQQVASLHGENTALREQNGSLASEIGKLRTKTTELLKQVAALQGNEASLIAQIAQLSTERATLMAENAELYEQAVGKRDAPSQG